MKAVPWFVLNRQLALLSGNVPNIVGSLPGEARIGKHLQYVSWNATRDPCARLTDGAIEQLLLRRTQQ